MTENVVTQNLRNFTVQIRPADSEVIVGTGIVVSADGKVVTCAHVVKSAGLEPRVLNGKELSVYFPQAQAGEKKERRAKVVAFFPDFDDDVVLLQLTDGSAPLGPEFMPVLGTAEASQDNPFRSYGYRRLEDYVAGWVHGTIRGHVEAPPKRNVQEEPVQLESNQINRGMSGSAVLDIDRNLVVGIISETWFPDKTGKDRDTGWAVDSRVLSLAPLGLTVQDAPLPLKPAPQPKADEQTIQQVVEVAQDTVAYRRVKEKYSWNNAPSVLNEWTGRDHLLARITEDWNNTQKHVVGLIGFGGEGKSSLARKWIETLERSNVKTFDGLFWWGFYENKSVDEFLEAALNYMSGGKIDPRQIQSSSMRAQIIGAMLGTGRYLFVLDGLEVMQHQEGDQYGLLQSNDLRDLLTFFARPDNQSFCLITSRAPVLDLMDYTTYTHRDVDRLSEVDGRALLRRLGVQGSDAELNKVVADWNGHALTLSLIGSYLVKVHHGDAGQVGDFDIEDDEEVESAVPNQYKHVGRILRRYDEHLTKEEKAFLVLFSAFRTPVHVAAFEKVFRTKTEATALNAPLTDLSEKEFNALVDRLVKYRILRFDGQSQTYTTHPLIRNHYFVLLTRGNLTPDTIKAAHEQIKDYYLSIAGDTPEYPTLDELKPLIEVVHHACQAGAYDEAWKIYWKRICQETRYVLMHHLGSYETELTTMYEFFPDNDLSKEVQGNNPNANKRWIPNTIGFCLMSLGRLREAVPFYQWVAKANFEAQDWSNTSHSYINLAELHANLGELVASVEAAGQGVDFARRAEDKFGISQSLSHQGWAAHLHGDLQSAKDIFSEAEEVEIERHNKRVGYLFSNRGIFHADHLHRTGQSDYAHRVTEANLQILEKSHLPYQISQCHRVLGDLVSDARDHSSARAHYESALKIARSISARYILIEALLARGRFLAKHMKDANAAFSDLNEAIGYCVESVYRIYEANVRVALAWAYLANGEKEKAEQSAERAKQMSNEMGYHWGKVDAEEVLKAISG